MFLSCCEPLIGPLGLQIQHIYACIYAESVNVVHTILLQIPLDLVALYSGSAFSIKAGNK